jgi:ribose transport system substrate-binding protein
MTTETAAPASTTSGHSRSGRSRLARTLIVILLLFIAITGALWYLGFLQPPPRVAIVTAGQGQYWDLIARGAEDAAHRYNLQLKVVRPAGDEASQTREIQSLLGQKFDGIAISPNDPPRQAAVLSDVATQTTLVTFDSDSGVSRKLCFIGTNNYEAGRQCGDQIRQAIPGGGEVILAIGSLDKENGQRRRQGVIDELLERPTEPNRPMDPVDAPLKGSKYTILATLVDGLDAARASALAAAALRQHPDVKCFGGLFAYSTPSILRALQSSNKLGQVQVVGFDAYDETLAGIESGTVFASIMQDAYSIGFETVRVLGDAARNDRQALPMYQQFYMSCDPVTKANVSQIRQDLHRKMTGLANRPAPAPGDVSKQSEPAPASTAPTP